MYSVIDKAHPEKVWFSKFRYEKPEPLWKDEYDYVPFLSRMMNAVARRLLRHEGMDFEKVLSLIYENEHLYDLMADWEYEGWEIIPEAYYRWYRDEACLNPLPDENLVLVENDKEHETFITALENARRRLGYTRADVFWARYRRKLMDLWNREGRFGASSKEMESYLEIAIPSFDFIEKWKGHR